MAVDLLDAPLRVTWDIPADPNRGLTPAQLAQIGDRMVEAGIFFVILEGKPLDHPGILPLLQRLDGKCQLALVTDGSPSQQQLYPQLPQNLILMLDGAAAVRDNRLDEELLAHLVACIREQGREVVLLWVPRQNQLQLLPEFIRFCLCHRVRRFKLPNQNIDANPELDWVERLPRCSDLEQLRLVLEQQGVPDAEELQLEVHDLFLWELLQPLSGGQRSEYGGCQAGNSLGHINPVGELYPCSSWPEPLGSLLDQNLFDLWLTPRRFTIREEIGEVPAGCEDCRDYPTCFGGCRGLSRFCRSDSLGRDLLCADKR